MIRNMTFRNPFLPPFWRAGLLCAALLAGAAAWSEGAAAAPVDAAVADFLGADMLDVISAADRVESFQLEAKGGMVMPAVQGYAVVEKGPDLTLDQVERLRQIIFAETSYLFDRSKRCPFLADTGFVFHAGQRQASVVLSQSCKLWSFAVGADRGKMEDYDPAEAELKSLVGELFERP